MLICSYCQCSNPTARIKQSYLKKRTEVGKDSWNTGLGSEKSTSPSTCTQRAWDTCTPACSLPHTEAALAPAWLCRGLQRGLWPWLSVCCSVSSHEHHDVPFSWPYPFCSQVFTPQVLALSLCWQTPSSIHSQNGICTFRHEFNHVLPKPGVEDNCCSKLSQCSVFKEGSCLLTRMKLVLSLLF